MINKDLIDGLEMPISEENLVNICQKLDEAEVNKIKIWEKLTHQLNLKIYYFYDF